MWQSIVQALFKKALYGAAGSLAGFLSSISVWQALPADAQGQLLWAAVIVPGVTGLAGAISRAVGYKPELAGR
jgi:hypothetical protein